MAKRAQITANPNRHRQVGPEPTPEDRPRHSVTGVFFGVVEVADRKFAPVRLDIERGAITQITEVGSPSSYIDNIYAVACDTMHSHGLDSAQYRYGKTKKEKDDA